MYRVKCTLICVAIVFVSIVCIAHGQDQKMDALKKEAVAWVESNKEVMNQTARRIWEYAETALLETKSSKELADFIESRGFKVQRGVADMPTAFVASYGSGKPVIGILGEFDALPGLSQKAGVPHKEALAEGQPGHGCGHNLLGVAGASGAIALKEVMAKHDIGGTVKFFGCPAEEAIGGKVFMAKAGLFKDLDICLDWHPGSENTVSLSTSNAVNNFTVSFHGEDCPRSRDPWDGRSALDGVELMDSGVNFLREHVRPTVRIHYIISQGGKAPNVVPDYAQVYYYVRGQDRAEVDETYARVLKIAEGATLMTETKHEVDLLTAIYNKLVNREVARLLHKNLQFVGPPQFSQEDQSFAHEVQKNLGVKEEGLSTAIKPLEEPKGFMGGGSTDVSDVSWNVPTATLGVACYPVSSPGHSWAITTCSGMTVGFKGMYRAAMTFAAAGIEALLDPKIIQTAQAEFRKVTKASPYKPALPSDKKPQLPKD